MLSVTPVNNRFIDLKNQLALAYEGHIDYIDEKRQKLETEIAKLEKQARAEKQPKKKFELVQQVKKLNQQLSEL